MLKKISVGGWITCAAALLTLVSLIVYSSNIARAGYFQGAAVTNLTLFAILAIVLYVAAVALGLLVKTEGPAAKAVELIVGVMQIAAPVLVAAAAISLIAARVEGLGFIYFSNADVALEIQTPANLASASAAITSMVLFGVSMLVGVVAAFFRPVKKDV